MYNAAFSPSFVLMNDSARPHTAAIVDDFLESEVVAPIKWPNWTLLLLNLNPTENLQNAFNHTLCKRLPPAAANRGLETNRTGKTALAGFCGG